MSDFRRFADIIDRLTQKRLALSTLSAKNAYHADNLKTAIERGADELFRWRAGSTDLRPGDIVAIYVPRGRVPRSKFLPASEEQKIRRIYSVAKAIEPNGEDEGWHYVFLYRPVTLQEPLRLGDLDFLLTRPESDDASRNMALGRKIQWLQRGRARLCSFQTQMFWKKVLSKNEHVAKDAGRLLFPLDEKSPYRHDIAISYSGEDDEDRECGGRLSLCFEKRAHRAFFVTPVETIGDQEGLKPQLEELLGQVYTSCTIGIVIIPHKFSCWMQFELKALMRQPDKLVFIRIDEDSRMGHELLERKVKEITGRSLPKTTPILTWNREARTKNQNEIVTTVEHLLRDLSK